jgi:hypothetical protein
MPGQKLEEVNDKAHLLRMPERMLKACQALAVRQRRSLNAQILWLIDGALDEEREVDPHECAGPRGN